MRWWDISRGTLVKAKSLNYSHWGTCRIIDRTTNGALLIEEVNHQSSGRFPKEGTKVRHYINASKLCAIDPLIQERI